MTINETDYRQKGIENLILLVLGVENKAMSILHLQKEIFLLWNAHPKIKEYLTFIKHYRGPFSKEIDETIEYPIYVEAAWTYYCPRKGDNLSGGYIKINENGQAEYNRITREIKKREDLLQLLNSIKLLRELYDKLSEKELLLLIYDTYPEYTEKSDVLHIIRSDKQRLAKHLLAKGFIDEQRYASLTED